ncbi:hypothetical protein BH09ACT8_BH09ACT8_58350 [soil metagenome]
MPRIDLEIVAVATNAMQKRSPLFTAARPGFLHHLEPLATLLGRIAPRLGAVQVLPIDRAT